MQNGYRAFETGPNSKEWNAVMVDHNTCRFGQWLTSDEGQAMFSHLPSYSRLDTPHQLVHQHIHHALEAITNHGDDYNTLKEEILREYQAAEVASQEMMIIISELINEKQSSSDCGTYELEPSRSSSEQSYRPEPTTAAYTA
ncbi:MAG: CZB domain-containing protein [Chromatiales bacterium]|nr:CZB domain-containing protein [Chromatiales bacterium]